MSFDVSGFIERKKESNDFVFRQHFIANAVFSLNTKKRTHWIIANELAKPHEFCFLWQKVVKERLKFKKEVSMDFKQKAKKFFKMKGLVSLSLQYAAAIVLLTSVLVGTNIAYGFEQEINSVLAKPIIDEKAYDKSSVDGQKMSARIMEEGSVLLQNKDNVLPLSTENTPKVNVFGWHSIDWLYGTGGDQVGSGGVLPEDDDFDKNIDFYKALDNYGIDYNADLKNMYYNYFKPFNLGRGLKVGNISEAQKLVEPDIEDKSYYSDELLEKAKSYSDTAIMVISRLSGEGGGNPGYQPKTGPKGESKDNERHYLEISVEEEKLLTYLGKNFDKVIVLINNCNQMELGKIETIEGVDACLYVGYTGTRGAVSIPKLLYGEVSPSGRTVDTFAYDLYTNPSVIWSEPVWADSSYLDKVAGIYIGYKWYETADEMGLWSSMNGYADGYKSVVQYPFGYGLSYTTFDWTVDGITVDGNAYSDKAALKKDSKIEFTVTVKNTGNVAGREVVEIYGTAPYKTGEIEKSSVELVNYGKTNLIEPNASETMKISVDMYDIASYDCYDKNNDGHKGYELDAGDYSFKLMKNSHEINTVNYGDKQIEGKFEFNLATTAHIDNDPVTGKTVKNLFTGDDAVDIVPVDNKTSTFDPKIPWISRAKFSTPAELSKQRENWKRDENPILKDYDKESLDRWSKWDDATTDEFGNPVNQTKPTWGASGDMKLAKNGVITELGQKLGENYDAPEWEEVLNQVKFDEALNVMNRYYGSKAIDSVGKPELRDLDGPTQVSGYSTAPRGTGYPSMVVLAQTWNQELAYDYGKSFGNDMVSIGVMGLWGFACDLHVDAFFGRNNESPSEDPFLAGTVIAKAVSGVNTRGRYTFLKHFAIYNAYCDRTYMSEQTLRETHLKAFRKAVVDGGTLGLMTSYQSVGAENSNYSVGLITGVLRNEWAFKGSVTTDAISGADYQFEGLVRCGGNLGMNVSLGKGSISYSQEETSGRMQNRMREAVHQILYMWLRSDYNYRYYQANGESDDSYFSSTSINSWVWWKPFLVSLDVVVGSALAFWVICATVNFVRKNNKDGEEKNEKTL
ncbi:MAG TPA: hypothetical protein DDW18_01015 [Firmicutes bacterium]|nr:hypothetical protein [Bacillota bacterium]